VAIVAIDVETVAAPVEGKWAGAFAQMWESVSDRYDSPRTMAALAPALCRIVCIGLVGVESGREVVLYDSSLCGAALAPDLPFQTIPCDGEALLLGEFNRVLTSGKVSCLVTFRGRTFDIPAIIHAMVANGIRPCAVLMAAFRESRFHQKAHADLWETFTAYGAVMAPGGTTLRAWAFRYGLEDPKAHGSGADVAALVQEQETGKLLTYQMEDTRATAALYRAWRSVMEAPVSEQASVRQ
jgi:hypothetical protein